MADENPIVGGESVPEPPIQITTKDPNEELLRRFLNHRPSNAGSLRADSASQALLSVAQYMQELLPEGREKAIVFTKLEEAGQWAADSLVRNPVTR